MMFDGKVSLEELLTIYGNNFQPVGYLGEEHRNLRFESGKKLLEEYYKKHVNDKVKHFGLEKQFNLDFAGTKFTVRIDRIDELPGGGVEIIDYKTGSAKDQKEVDKDDQVTIYAAATKKALHLNPKLLSLYFLESGKKISTTRTEKQLNETETEVAEVVLEMKKGNFEATPGMHCAFCDFRNICPFVFNN
jgi:putative RecB family exonuclease